MKYKLYNENIQINNIDDILKSRGINDVDKWKNAGWNEINSPFAFGKEVVEKAVDFIIQAVKNKWKVCVIVDSDCDGYTASAIALNYLYQLYSWNLGQDKCKELLTYYIHNGKQHGLEDCYKDLPQDAKLIWLPDCATNDVKEMKYLIARGKKIIVTDHHMSDEWLVDDNVAILNNQICDYPNKDLSGAGVTWQLCRAYDEICGLHFANDYIDLAALGCSADMMDYTSIETRAIIQEGLKNIKNPYFYYMAEKNKFSIDKMGGINYMSVSWYIAPFVNAMCRTGTMEEKDLIFKSFLQMYAFDKVESGKRGHKGELVPLVEEAVRVCGNVKNRQTKLQNEAMDFIREKIEDEDLLDHGIIMILAEQDEIDPSVRGLIANKIQAEYQHPCYILTKSKTKDDEEYFYRGSGRNYSMSENQDLRSTVLETGLVESCEGHNNAHGLSIAERNIDEFIKKTDEQYKNISHEPVYIVDCVWSKNEVNPQMILDIANEKEYWGQGISEPLICLKDIPIGINNVQLLSKDKNPTIKIHLDCGVDIMKFKSSIQEYEKLTEPNTLITLVGKANANSWMGRTTAQIMCDSYELSHKWVF